MKILKTATSPKVGIFWLYKGGIISFMADARQEASALKGKSLTEWVDSPYDHYATWDQVTKMYPELAQKDYVDIPRGRVLYNIKRKIFRVLSSSTVIANKGDLVKIGREFSLPPNATEAMVDAHYEMQPEFDYEGFGSNSEFDDDLDDDFE